MLADMLAFQAFDWCACQSISLESSKNRPPSCERNDRVALSFGRYFRHIPALDFRNWPWALPPIVFSPKATKHLDNAKDTLQHRDLIESSQQESLAYLSCEPPGSHWMHTGSWANWSCKEHPWLLQWAKKIARDSGRRDDRTFRKHWSYCSPFEWHVWQIPC